MPKIVTPDNKVTVTIWAGSLEGKQALPPPPNSYGSNPASELGIWYLKLAPGGKYTLPAAAGGKAINRMLYFIEGQQLQLNGESVKTQSAVTVNADQTVDVVNPHGSVVTEVLVLQGRPIGEPVAQHGPFVMNTQAEIQQAFADYRKTQFGGWPWPQDAMVFPREKGRFSLLNGVKTFPGTCSNDPTTEGV